MQAARLIVVRHGETLWNTQGRWQGHDDSSLTPKGLSQAEAVGRHLSNEDFSIIYTSDLGRARHTAEIIADATGKTVKSETRLRERHLGVFQGLTVSEMAEQYPELFHQYQQGDSNFIIPEGESLQQKHNRSIACFTDIASRHPGDAIVVVTHGGVINALARHAAGIPLDAEVSPLKIWNAGINTFLYQNAKWEIVAFGEVSHLSSDAA